MVRRLLHQGRGEQEEGNMKAKRTTIISTNGGGKKKWGGWGGWLGALKRFPLLERI